MNPLSLLSGPYGWLIKILSTLVVVVAVFFFGYYKGYQNEKTITVTKTVIQIKKQIQYVTKTEQPKEAKQVKANATVHDNVISRIPEVTPPPVLACPDGSWGPDTIGLLNTQRGMLP